MKDGVDTHAYNYSVSKHVVKAFYLASSEIKVKQIVRAAIWRLSNCNMRGEDTKDCLLKSQTMHKEGFLGIHFHPRWFDVEILQSFCATR